MVRLILTDACFFSSVTMKDTRLTALETEVPVVPRTGKGQTQSSGWGKMEENHLSCLWLYWGKDISLHSGLTLMVLATCQELDLLCCEVISQITGNFLTAYSVPGMVLSAFFGYLFCSSQPHFWCISVLQMRSWALKCYVIFLRLYS